MVACQASAVLPTHRPLCSRWSASAGPVPDSRQAPREAGTSGRRRASSECGLPATLANDVCAVLQSIVLYVRCTCAVSTQGAPTRQLEVILDVCHAIPSKHSAWVHCRSNKVLRTVATAVDKAKRAIRGRRSALINAPHSCLHDRYLPAHAFHRQVCELILGRDRRPLTEPLRAHLQQSNSRWRVQT